MPGWPAPQYPGRTAKLERRIQAYGLGFLPADGNVLEKHHRVTVELSSADEPLLERVRDQLVPGGAITGHCRQGRNSVTLAFVSRQMISDLAVYGVTPAKSLNLMWPAALPEALTRPFILGFFDADGFITAHKRANGSYPYLGITSGSRAFLVSIVTKITAESGATIGGPLAEGGVKRLCAACFG